MSVCRPDLFFFPSWGKVTGQHSCHNPGPCKRPCGDSHQGKLLPRHNTGDLQRTEGSSAVCGVVGSFSVSLFACLSDVSHLLLYSPQIFLSD